MASIDFSKLSPEEVAALSPADKKKYDKWLAKQSTTSSGEKVEVMILAKKEFNTTLYGNFKPGQKGKCLKKLAEQLEEQEFCEIIEEEE